MARPDPTQFQYQHLPPHLAQIARPFAELAGHLASAIPGNSDSDAALENLLSARDLALRAMRHDPNQPRLDLGGRDGVAFEADHSQLPDPG